MRGGEGERECVCDLFCVWFVWSLCVLGGGGVEDGRLRADATHTHIENNDDSVFGHSRYLVSKPPKVNSLIGLLID